MTDHVSGRKGHAKQDMCKDTAGGSHGSPGCKGAGQEGGVEEQSECRSPGSRLPAPGGQSCLAGLYRVSWVWASQVGMGPQRQRQRQPLMELEKNLRLINHSANIEKPPGPGC